MRPIDEIPDTCVEALDGILLLVIPAFYFRIHSMWWQAEHDHPGALSGLIIARPCTLS